MALRYSANLGPISRLRDGLALRVRRRVFEIFMRECAPTAESQVADFGVSGHDDHAAHSFFEQLYPHPTKLTAIGREAEGAGWYPEKFPGVTFLEADLRSIPLSDNHFDCGLCNAVIEHAGNRAQQEALVREVCRVCKIVLFATPNRGFPIELHTFIPVVHWLPINVSRRVYRALGQGYFADEDNLNPLYATALEQLAPRERSNALMRVGPPLLATNLILISRRAADEHDGVETKAPLPVEARRHENENG